MYKIEFSKQSQKDAKNLQAAKLTKKAQEFVDIVRENPFQSPPPFESLTENLRGLYSRRLNIQHRFVYQVIDKPMEINGVKYEGTVKIIRMWTHYESI